ncbi:MAG: DNRLRE domain-containing protein [Crocosphaera sp.]|nr:DNRLRE domain-containing protein [Crocosphaera sp.]
MKYIKLIFISCCIILLCLVTTATAQETKTLIPSKDNTLIEDVTGSLSNGKGQMFFVGRTNQPQDSVRRGIIAFDIAKTIPSGSKITSVTLTLTLKKTPGGNQSVELHKVLKNWGEGTSNHRGGRGDQASLGDVTWIHNRYDNQFWATPGGDFLSTISGITVVGNEGNYTWESTEQMITDVQNWLDKPQENFGWLLLGNETQRGTVKGFASREIMDSSDQPKLKITYLK